MAILDVLRFPDERLRKKARPVEHVDAEVRSIIDDMFDTMYQETGIGLAATQVDIQQCIYIADFSEKRNTP